METQEGYESDSIAFGENDLEKCGRKCLCSSCVSLELQTSTVVDKGL